MEAFRHAPNFIGTMQFVGNKNIWNKEIIMNSKFDVVFFEKHFFKGRQSQYKKLIDML